MLYQMLTSASQCCRLTVTGLMKGIRIYCSALTLAKILEHRSVPGTALRSLLSLPAPSHQAVMSFRDWALRGVRQSEVHLKRPGDRGVGREEMRPQGMMGGLLVQELDFMPWEPEPQGRSESVMFLPETHCSGQQPASTAILLERKLEQIPASVADSAGIFVPRESHIFSFLHGTTWLCH